MGQYSCSLISLRWKLMGTDMEMFKGKVLEKRCVERGVVSHQSGHFESLWYTLIFAVH